MIKNRKKIGVSTGLLAEINYNQNGKVNKNEFDGTVTNMAFDHVALLLDVPPAGENTYTINHDSKPRRKGIPMDEVTFDLSPLAQQDRLTISQLTVNELHHFVVNRATFDEARQIVEKAGFQVNQVDAEAVQQFLDNKEAFEAYQAKQNEDLQELKQFIVDNSKMSMDDLLDMSQTAIENLAKTVTPKHKRVGNGKTGGAPSLVLINDDTGE